MELRAQRLLADDGYGWQCTRQKSAGPDVKYSPKRARATSLSRIAEESTDVSRRIASSNKCLCRGTSRRLSSPANALAGVRSGQALRTWPITQSGVYIIKEVNL